MAMLQDDHGRETPTPRVGLQACQRDKLLAEMRKRMNQFKVIMHQRRANQSRYLSGGQFIVPCYQMIEQKLDVASILLRLITAAMSSIAYVRHDVFGVIPYQSGLIVLMGNAIGNGGMYLFNEIDRRAPVRALR